MKKVSIIMPVYNAERYLREAVDSVLRQTYTAFELLLINDRSSDESVAICREYGERDSRIVLLENDTETHGPGPTRNIGLDHASGEYIYFMDADDWIEENLLECAVERMQETGADIVEFGVIYEYNGQISNKYCWNGKSALSKDQIDKKYIMESPKNLWIRLYCQKTVQNIRFESIINGEDVCYVMDALSQAKKIAFTADTYYHYRCLEESTCHRWVESTIDCLGVQWKHQCRFVSSLPGRMTLESLVAPAYENYTWALFQLSAAFCPLSFREKRKELSKLREIMGFERYRDSYPIEKEHGLMRVKFMLIKYHLEWLMLLLGPLYYRIVQAVRYVTRRQK